MFDFSFYELVVFAVIALIVLGPEKLPQAVRTAGKYYAKFRRTVGTIRAEMEAELDLIETRQKMQEELAKIKQAEADMQAEMARLKGSVEQMKRQSATDDTDSNASNSNASNLNSTQTALSKSSSKSSSPTNSQKNALNDNINNDVAKTPADEVVS